MFINNRLPKPFYSKKLLIKRKLNKVFKIFLIKL